MEGHKTKETGGKPVMDGSHVQVDIFYPFFRHYTTPSQYPPCPHTLHNTMNPFL